MATALATESAEVRREATAEGPIVFYDGDCGLCAQVVKYVLHRDKEHIFRFAPLQGETAITLIGPPTGKPDAWSFVLLDADGTYDRSTAALKVLKHLKRGAFWASVGMAFPRIIRDGVYRIIAKVRYRIWGKTNQCSLPTKDQRAQFLP